MLLGPGRGSTLDHKASSGPVSRTIHCELCHVGLVESKRLASPAGDHKTGSVTLIESGKGQRPWRSWKSRFPRHLRQEDYYPSSGHSHGSGVSGKEEEKAQVWFTKESVRSECESWKWMAATLQPYSKVALKTAQRENPSSGESHGHALCFVRNEDVYLGVGSSSFVYL